MPGPHLKKNTTGKLSGLSIMLVVTVQSGEDDCSYLTFEEIDCLFIILYCRCMIHTENSCRYVYYVFPYGHYRQILLFVHVVISILMNKILYI